MTVSGRHNLPLLFFLLPNNWLYNESARLKS